MEEYKKYGFYDVFVGILADFPKGRNSYISNDEKILDFVSENQDNYSVLRNIAIDKDGVFPSSQEVYEGLDILKSCKLLKSDSREIHIDRAVNVAWNIFSRQKFNGIEIEEIKNLSSKFVGEFCG